MGKFDVNAPPPRNYAAEGKETIEGQIAVAPDVYAAEAEYGPKYAALGRDTFKESVRDLGPFIESDVMPLLARLERTAQRGQREGDIADIEQFGARATRAVREATPELTRSLDRVEDLNKDFGPYMASSGGYDPHMLGRGERVGDARMGPSWMQNRLEFEAAEGLMAGRDLSRREVYDAEQSSRAAYEDRGLGRSQGALAAEVLTLDSARHARQRDRQGFAAGVERLGQPIRMADQQAQLRSGMFNVGEQRARALANQYSYNAAAQNRSDAWNLAERGNQAAFNQAQRDRRAYALDAAGTMAAGSLDPYMAITGRPSRAGGAAGGYLPGAGAFSNAGPSLFDSYNSYASDLYNTNYNAEAAARIGNANRSASFREGLLRFGAGLF